MAYGNSMRETWCRRSLSLTHTHTHTHTRARARGYNGCHSKWEKIMCCLTATQQVVTKMAVVFEDTYVYVCVYIYTHIYIHTHTHVCVCVCISTYAYIYVHILYPCLNNKLYASTCAYHIPIICEYMYHTPIICECMCVSYTGYMRVHVRIIYRLFEIR